MGQVNFIKFDGIEGESVHRGHEGEIDVLTWSWGVDAPVPAGASGGSSASKPTPSAFHFMHSYDKAAPLLARACARGKATKLVVLTARRGGDVQDDFLKVTMKDVLITSVHASAADSTGQAVALVPRSITFEYQPMQADGSAGTPVGFSWNLATGTVK